MRNTHFYALHINKLLRQYLNAEADCTLYIGEALERTERCLKHTKSKYATEEINIYHTIQFAILLYYLSNTAFHAGCMELCNQVYYLNKIMHAIDWFYAIDLPEYWYAEHPLGSVLGRACYNNGLMIYQGCTIGGNMGLKDEKIEYPTLGKNVIMFANSAILGSCKIGDNVIVSAGARLINEEIPDNCLVFGQSPNIAIKQKPEDEIRHRIEKIWK